MSLLPSRFQLPDDIGDPTAACADLAFIEPETPEKAQRIVRLARPEEIAARRERSGKNMALRDFEFRDHTPEHMKPKARGAAWPSPKEHQQALNKAAALWPMPPSQGCGIVEPTWVQSIMQGIDKQLASGMTATELHLRSLSKVRMSPMLAFELSLRERGTVPTIADALATASLQEYLQTPVGFDADEARREP